MNKINHNKCVSLAQMDSVYSPLGLSRSSTKQSFANSFSSVYEIMNTFPSCLAARRNYWRSALHKIYVEWLIDWLANIDWHWEWTSSEENAWTERLPAIVITVNCRPQHCRHFPTLTSLEFCLFFAWFLFSARCCFEQVTVNFTKKNKYWRLI